MEIKTHFSRILIFLASFLTLTACSGDSSTLPLICDVPGCTLVSEPTLDGMVLNNGVVVTDSTILQPRVGDLDATLPGLAARQFFSFNIATVPPAAIVTSATLRLYQYFITGQPYTDLGNVVVDHINYGTALDSGDYNTAAIAGNIGTLLSTDGTVEYKEIDVTSSVLNDITNGRTASQFRLRFSGTDSNNDGGDDYVAFTDGELQPAPQLILVLN